MDKITIERETVELAASLIQPLTGKGDREVYDVLRAALAAQPAEPVEPVAWLRFQEHADRPTTVHLCDSDHPRAFQVYAAQPAPAAVPPGYVLVPIEPTPEMVDAGDVARHSVVTQARTSVIYRAMIAAAGDKI